MEKLYLDIDEVIKKTKFKSLNLIILLKNIKFIDRNEVPTELGFKMGVLNIKERLKFSPQFQEILTLTYEIERRHHNFSSKIQNNELFIQNFAYFFNALYNLINKDNNKSDSILSDEELDSILFKEEFKNRRINKIQTVERKFDDRFTRH